MPAPLDPSRFEERYRDRQLANGLPAATPWDIGVAQPVVRRLVALGAITGEVLDPGTGPGHNAIHIASKGYSVTGIDISPTAIERARRNAQEAGVSVTFELGDAVKLDGITDRFDTVVDCAFYHTFSPDPELGNAYFHALHRATRPAARLYLFTFGPPGVSINGFAMPRSITEDELRQPLAAHGWDITYLGPTTYQINAGSAMFETRAVQNPALNEATHRVLERFRRIEGWLDGNKTHAPFWEVHATRR